MQIFEQAKFALAHLSHEESWKEGKNQGILYFVRGQRTKYLVLFVFHNHCFDIRNISYDLQSFIKV